MPVQDAVTIEPAAKAVLEVERRVVRWWHPIVVLVALLLLYWIAQTVGLRDAVVTMRDWVERVGNGGPIVFVVGYVLLTMLGIPGSWLTLAAGALFGSLVGVLAVIVASTASSMLAFFVARRWMRRRVEKWLGRNRRFRQLNHLVDRHGPATVLVVRLINLFPFALVNYGFGLTRVDWRTYAVWSFVGKIPGTVVMVVGVDAIIHGLLKQQIPWNLVIIVLTTAALLAIMLRIVHHRLEAGAAGHDEGERGAQKNDATGEG